MKRVLLAGAIFFAAMPATSNYKLNSYGFGSGSTSNSQTATYSLNGSTGELSGTTTSTSNSSIKPGYTEVRQANVPKLAVLDNNGGEYYNRLHFVIDEQGNPADATYLLAVSTDNFATDTRYLKPDGTLTTVLSIANYQTYSSWGGAAGSLIIGLDESTNYSVKVKATQGDFTESAFGPATSASTSAASLTFSLTTSNQVSPPYSISFGQLEPGTVSSAAQTINTSLSTNAASGANVYVKSQNSGLLSGSTGFKINAVSTDLTSVSKGFGLQSSSAGQASGGPFTAVSPYDGAAEFVGSIDSSTNSLYTSSNPVTSAAGILRLKAKASDADVAASDYQEIITFTAASNF